MLTAYKLLRVRKNGTLGSLFINRREVLPIGRWLRAGVYPTSGFKVRGGWHTLARPVAPHLGRRHERRWYKVELKGRITEVKRPTLQGGKWYLARWMRIVEEYRGA